MSAQSQLFGLFPLGTGPTFTPNVPGYPVVDGTPDLFQPIPIHTVAKDEDSLLYAHDICPVYQDALDALETSSEWYTKEKETAVLRATIAPLVGLESVTLKLLKKIYSMWNINEVHHVEHLDGLTELKDQLKAVALWINQKKWGMGKEMGRRLGGNMIREFMQRMDDVLNLPDSPKLLLYSAHDSTIKNLLSALCVPLMKLPPFNSSVVFELWRQEATGDILVNSFLDWEVLELPLCTAPCTLTRFKEGYEEMVPSDWAAECAVQGPSSGGEPSMEWLWLVLAFVGGGSVMFLAEYMVARRRRRRRMDDSDEEMPSGRSYGSLQQRHRLLVHLFFFFCSSSSMMASAAAVARSTDRLLVSWSSPARTISSRMKNALWKLKMRSSSHTFPKQRSKTSTQWWMSSNAINSFSSTVTPATKNKLAQRLNTSFTSRHSRMLHIRRGRFRI
eukprot:TRINITY_DN6811_c0_g1_i1.p1 TRINITY_DN6811_c0_g1~~TRINITY_DN6811_c0_g1_i1.p1  ORF type:complete len:507 (-),score=59.48 TRINITY_DN6811_c0_g1_i1:118-1455(-)